jgi:hypothetical protein
MSADLASLYIKVDSKGVVTASKDLDELTGKAQKTEDSTRKVTRATDSANASFMSMANAVKALAASYAVLKLAQYVKEATMLASRYETLGVVMRVVGNNAGYTGAQMEVFAKSLEKAGISMIEARQTLTRMVQANLDLAQSSKLARVAQDAAVIGNINSSEAFQRMVYGIQSGQVEILRTIGINVNFENSYQKVAKATGRVTAQLSEAEKSQIRMNAVMDAGQRIAGTYAGAMETAGKQVLSLPRHLENLKDLTGALFTPALSVVIQEITGDVTALNGELSGASKSAISNWGKEFAGTVSTVISAIKTISAPVIAAIKLIWECRDALIALGIAFAAFKIGMFLTTIGTIIPTLSSIIMALEMAKIAVLGFMMTFGPVGLGIAALSAIVGAAYFAYKKFTGGAEDAKQALIEFQQKADAMDLAQVEGELESVRIKMRDIKEINDKFIFNPFGFSGKLDAQALKDMERYLVDRRAVLATDAQMAKAKKELNDLLAKNEAAEKAAAEKKAAAAKEAAEAAQKLREEADKINETLGNDIKMSGLDELEKKLFEIQIKYEKLAKNPLVDKGLLSTARGNEESSARWEARSQELKKEAELTQEITKAEEELIKTIQDGYDATMAGIQKQYDADGQLLRDKLELYKDLTGFEDEYRQVQLDWIERIKNEEIKATGDVAAAEKKAAKERAQIEYNLFKTKTDYIADGFGQLQSAFSDIASVYEKGSDAARQWETAAKAMEIAQEAVAVVQAVGAIATQGLGDPYTAFARIAAMAATMGSLLATIGKSVGGGSFATASAPAMGNSTVLGAAYGTESESIANSLEILKDTYDLENSKLTKIYDELRDLNNNITGLVSGIIRAGGSFDGMTIENDAVAATKAREIFMGVDVIRTLHKWGGELLGIKNLEIWADPISYIVNNLLGDLVQSVVTGIFGGEKTVATIGAGYKIGGSSIKDIMSGGVNTQQYQTILSKTSGGWFHDDEVFIGTIYRKVDAEVANLFNKVFQNLGGTLVGLAEQLGTDIEDALAYKFKDIKLNLMGKDGEGISKAISEALSAAGDNAAKALFGEMISRYQQVNEGMLETAVRLVTDKESVLAVLRLTNQSFTGTTSKLIEFSESLISVAGNLEELTDAFQTYYDAFFSDAEKQADTKRALSAALGMYGFDLPGSRSGYRELVESLNLTTEAGQAAYVALMQMSQSADEYYKYLEQAKGNIKPENYATELEYKRAMAGFSDGGLSYGPESGYEAKLHGTELIISQKKGVPAKVQGMNTGELVTEIRALRSEVGQGNFYSKANADKIVKLLDRWEAIGPQPART